MIGLLCSVYPQRFGGPLVHLVRAYSAGDLHEISRVLARSFG
jgi:hypothetical protein